MSVLGNVRNSRKQWKMNPRRWAKAFSACHAAEFKYYLTNDIESLKNFHRLMTWSIKLLQKNRSVRTLELGHHIQGTMQVWKWCFPWERRRQRWCHKEGKVYAESQTNPQESLPFVWGWFSGGGLSRSSGAHIPGNPGPLAGQGASAAPTGNDQVLHKSLCASESSLRALSRCQEHRVSTVGKGHPLT